MAYKRQKDDRPEQIIQAFITVAKRLHYNAVTRHQVAQEAGISNALVTKYFNDSMRDLRLSVVEYSIENDIYEIIAQSIVINDTPTANFTPVEKFNILGRF
jgi:DNA-binding transcriptional regulator YbjK